MDETLTTLQELALDLVQDGHASASTLEGPVRLLLGNGVSRQQITGALEALRELGLVEAFARRDDAGPFERYRRPKVKPGADVWWYATDAGKRENAGGA